jgi:hypothetical protein
MSVGEVEEQLRLGAEGLNDGVGFVTEARQNIQELAGIVEIHKQVNELAKLCEGLWTVADTAAGNFTFAEGQYTEATEHVLAGTEGSFKPPAIEARELTRHMVEGIGSCAAKATAAKEDIEKLKGYLLGAAYIAKHIAVNRNSMIFEAERETHNQQSAVRAIGQYRDILGA